MIFLERRLVRILNAKLHKKHYTRIEFTDFIKKRIWPRWNYFYNKDKFSLLIWNAFDSCIKNGYIECPDNKESLALVKYKGQEFITFSGFCEEYIKRRKRYTSTLVTVFTSATFGLIVGYIIGYFFPK